MQPSMYFVFVTNSLRLIRETSLRWFGNTKSRDTLSSHLLLIISLVSTYSFSFIYPLPTLLVSDIQDSIFLYSSKKIYEMTVKNETSYLWRKLLSGKDFEQALTFASKPYQKDKVAAIALE